MICLFCSLTRHRDTQKHIDAVKLSKASLGFTVSMKNVEKKADDNLMPQLRTAYYICKQGLAIDKFSSLMELQKLNGAPITTHYNHHEQVEEMIAACSKTLEATLKRAMGAADFISIIVDESCDVAVFKKLIIYVKLVVDGKVQVMFAENKDVPDGKAATIFAAIMDFLENNDVPQEKLAGLGSDGAKVMTGVYAGVGVQLKERYPILVHVHCMAHRLALAVSQSAGEIPQLRLYQSDINCIYTHYQNSSVKYNKLRAMQEIMETTVSLKQMNAVRWLSLDYAVDAIFKSWPSLVAVLGEEAASGNAVARGLSAKVESYTFIAYTCMLVDILPLFSKLSKVLQSDSLDYNKFCVVLDVVRNSLQAMSNTTEVGMPHLQQLVELPVVDGQVTYLGVQLTHRDSEVAAFRNQKSNFLGELLTQLDRRFPADGMELLKCLHQVLAPQFAQSMAPEHLPEFATAELSYVRHHFGQLPALALNPERARGDFLPFKQYLRQNTSRLMCLFFEELIMGFCDVFPDFVIMAKFYLSIPLNSAECERGFSVQNNIKTKSRNRLGGERLDEIMRIRINGPPVSDFRYDEAAAIFRAQRDRRL